MFGLFKKAPLLSDDYLRFQIETFKWLMKYFGGDAFFKETVLVEPTDRFFPTQINAEENVALATFEKVKEYAGMAKWQCELLAQDPDDDIHMGPTLMVKNAHQSPQGTFSVEQNRVVITYNPSLIQQPMQLVATFAHELSHYLTAGAPEAPPGGWENWEFATDLTAVFLGFGVFMSNSAFNFQQFSEVDAIGWSSSKSGYLSELELLFATAIFCKLQDVELATAQRHLKPNLKKVMKRCFKELEEMHSVIAEVKSVQFEPS